MDKRKYHLAPEKAYNRRDFIHSPEGRVIRVISEYQYPEKHFKKNNINNLIIFFGSARSLPKEEYESGIAELENKIRGLKGTDKNNAENELKLLKNRKIITESYEDAVKLSAMLTEWSLNIEPKKRFHICSGGGPGMMEAANKGAFESGGKSVGLNISLPHEQGSNPYITPELNFEFHYFFMRKFWFVYLGKALVVFPGGFGTLDELMEILTLIQTQKVTKHLPIVLYCREFWKKLINFDYLVEMGMISKHDLDLFRYADSPEDAFEFLTTELSVIHNIQI